MLVAFGILACGQKTHAELEAEALNRGIQSHNEGKIDEATSAYFETLRENANNKYAFYNLGQIQLVAKRYVAAESYYRLALQIDPDFGPALFGLALVRAAQGFAQEAIELYRRVILTDPNNAAAHYNLGLLLRASGRAADGDAEIARGIQLDPSVGPPPTPEPTPTPSPTAQPSPTR
jgi:tetratricopeptide (TPR) repeat protein